jgi:hypothetical protein
MVRRILSVLALLPLLLPPGMCVCHAAPVACAVRHGDDDHGSVAYPCLTHDCAANHHDSECPSEPDHHAPGCPVSQGLHRWAAKPAAAVQVPDLDLAELVVPLDSPSFPFHTTSRVMRLGLLDGPLPLYLTLRTLLV